MAFLLIGLETGNKLLAECGYLTTQLVSPSSSIRKVAEFFSPVVSSVTLYDGMGKVSENRGRGTYTLDQLQILFRYNTVRKICVTFLHKTLVVRFITSINTKRVTSQLRCVQQHAQGFHINVSVITARLCPKLEQIYRF